MATVRSQRQIDPATLTLPESQPCLGKTSKLLCENKTA